MPGLPQVDSQFLGRATLYDVFHFGVGFVFLVVGAIRPRRRPSYWQYAYRRCQNREYDEP